MGPARGKGETLHVGVRGRANRQHIRKLPKRFHYTIHTRRLAERVLLLRHHFDRVVRVLVFVRLQRPEIPSVHFGRGTRLLTAFDRKS